MSESFKPNRLAAAFYRTRRRKVAPPRQIPASYWIVSKSCPVPLQDANRCRAAHDHIRLFLDRERHVHGSMIEVLSFETQN